MAKNKKLNYNKEELMKKHDFNYIREHFYDRSYTINDVRKDITEVYGDELGLSQLSADGKNTVRVTNYFVMETQSKATSVRAKMSPHRAINDDDALCEIFNRIDTHPRFFNIRKDTEERLISEGSISLEPDELKLYNEGKLNLREYLLATPIPDESDFRREGIIENRDNLLEQLNIADLKEVRRAVAHMPSFHRVSQFPNHVAQRIYERYAPLKGGIILDSSCVDEDTEYFNGTEWKKIKDYTEGEFVLQYNLGHTASLVKPLRYIHYKDSSKPFYHFTSYNTDQMLTGDHNVVSVHRINQTSALDYSVVYKTPLEQYLNAGYPLDRTRIPTTVGGLTDIDTNKFNLTELELRFIIAVQADVSLTPPYFTRSDKHYFKTNPVYPKGTLRLYKSYAKFSKQHKIERFRWLLEQLNIPYRTSIYKYPNPKHKDQVVFEFTAPEFVYNNLNSHKDFPQDWLYTMSPEMRDVFIDEIFKWDATGGHIYITTNKHNADFVYTLLLTSDIMPKLSIEDKTNIKGKEHYKLCYYVSTNNTKSCSLFNKYPYTIEYKEDKYCFTVPSGMLVLRRNGIPFITGNCGWGNRLMATMSSKYGYKYLGTDPNSEMHPNYYALAKTIYETVYYGKDAGLDSQGNIREFPKDFFDIRDQGSEFDIPEWHNFSGYISSKDNPSILINAFTNVSYTLPDKLELNKEYLAWEVTHPSSNGKGCCDTGTLNTTGAKLPPIYQTHDDLIFYSGIGDLSFTSPPYFFLECYTEDSQKGDLSTGQSAGKGAKYTDWIKNFVYPTIVNHFNYLKPGGYYIYNLKDLPKDNLYLYSDWLSACLDVGFELIEQPEMILKSRRQFGKKASNDDPSGLSEAIDFNGATERVAVLRKPLNPTDEIFKPDNIQALYHVQRNFNYPLLSACRPDEFTSKLPTYIEDYLKEKFKNKKSKFIK